MLKLEKNTGITLVALIVTIIILLILAGITISQLRDNGLLENSKYAVDETKKKEIGEQINLAVLASYGTDGKIDNNLLKENLNKIKGIEKIEEVVYPLIAKVDEYEFKISENGDVTYNGEIKLADGTVDSSRGIEPSGTIDITENGEYDVTNYAMANVSIPQNTPTGTKEIKTSENNIDVSNYQYADTSSLYTETQYQQLSDEKDDLEEELEQLKNNKIVLVSDLSTDCSNRKNSLETSFTAVAGEIYYIIGAYDFTGGDMNAGTFNISRNNIVNRISFSSNVTILSNHTTNKYIKIKANTSGNTTMTINTGTTTVENSQAYIGRLFLQIYK